MKNKSVPNLVYVLDAESALIANAVTTVLWKSYVSNDQHNAISIPQQVEDNAERLRARYLEWIYDLGEANVRGKRVVDHLLLRPGLSYWWMTQIAEKCNFEKSPLIDDAIRFMAFEEWALGRRIDQIELATGNRALEKCMQIWCKENKIPLTLLRLKSHKIKLSWLRHIYGWLPLVLQALVWLMHYLFMRWTLRGVGLREWRSSPARITFVSYLFNLVPEATACGKFECRYWGVLPEALQATGCSTNWLHIYVKNELLPTAKQAAKHLRSLNKIDGAHQHHVVLDSFLGPKVVLRALYDWSALMCTSIRMRKWLLLKQYPKNHLRAFVTGDWTQSIYGVSAINNLLTFNLLESALNNQHIQNHGVYLQENQGWEFGLVHAWKTAGHHRLIGSPHSTIRFWDLRYFFDPKSYCRVGKNNLPLPDLVACNGSAMRKAMELASYPTADLVDVEALRYLELLSLKKKKRFVRGAVNQIRVLVIGDYILKNTQLQMRLLEKAVQLLKINVTLLIKPHPACPINMRDYSEIKYEISTKPITELMMECDVAYSSVLTSGAVDAYCGGMPTIVAMDPGALNLSPLRGYDGVLFVGTSEELASALLSLHAKPHEQDKKTNFFNLDFQVNQWKKLLKN